MVILGVVMNEEKLFDLFADKVREMV